MRLQRDFDAKRANAFANHPAVFPFVKIKGQREIDVSAVIADRRNYALMSDTGGFLFTFQEKGVYHLHTTFLPEGRGRHVVKCAQEAAEYMFCRTDCMEILTVVPFDNFRARPPLHLGFQLDFVREHAFERDDSGPISCEFWALRYHDWYRRAGWLEEEGARFHTDLETKMAEAGLDHDPHPTDKAHDRAVGMCVKMIRGGQPAKGLALFNRWAAFAGYRHIDVLQIPPADLVLDIGTAILRVDKTGSFEVSSHDAALRSAAAHEGAVH